MRMDAELANMSWKIKWDDLLFKGHGKSLGASLKSLSNHVSFKLLFLIASPVRLPAQAMVPNTERCCCPRQYYLMQTI